jgi:hypothetical protein
MNLDTTRLLKLAGVINESYVTQLDEAREDFIAQQMGDKILAAYGRDHGQKPKLTTALEIVNYIVQQLTGANKKNIQQVMSWYVNGDFALEDTNTVDTSINQFNSNKKTLGVSALTQYKTLGELNKALMQFATKAEEHSDSVKKEAYKNTDKVIWTDNFKVVTPKSRAASEFWGSPHVKLKNGDDNPAGIFRWCTANPQDKHNLHDRHADDGPLYIVAAGHGDVSPLKANRVYQLHYESGQFMDENNSPIKPGDIDYLCSFPEYTEFLNMLIKKHYAVDSLED